MVATAGVTWPYACVSHTAELVRVPVLKLVNFGPAVYISKMFFSLSPQTSSEEQLQVLPKGSVLGVFCFAVI